MTAEQIKAFFDVNSVLIMLAFGFVYKYVPQLDKLWNWLIPYLNTAGYILTRLLAPGDAHAADGVAIGGGIVALAGFANTFWAKLLYDGFAKPVIEHFFGRHKSDIRHDIERGLTVNVAEAKKPAVEVKIPKSVEA